MPDIVSADPVCDRAIALTFREGRLILAPRPNGRIALKAVGRFGFLDVAKSLEQAIEIIRFAVEFAEQEHRKACMF